MNPIPPHFVIEEGPERGRELTIPAEGARVGRATENDVVIADASMSRFQCRFYFSDGFLHVMDLGSTNTTLVNDEPVSDTALRHGDQILIGDSLLRVVNDGLADPSMKSLTPPVEPAEPLIRLGGDPAPVTPVSPPVPPPVVAEDVDLGFGRKGAAPVQRASDGEGKRSLLGMVLAGVITMLVVVVVGVFWIMMEKQNEPPPRRTPADQGFQIHYEKVQATDQNIFRYALELDGPNIQVAIHDLANQVVLERSAEVDADTLSQFKQSLRDMEFFKLQDLYDSAITDELARHDITLVFGRRAKRVVVENQREPDAFRQVRQAIETFAENELQLGTMNMPPDELRRMAQEAWLVGNKLYDERNIKESNLWNAHRKFKEVEWLLQSIEPKPPHYRQAIERKAAVWDELVETVQNLVFLASRETNTGNWEGAARYYRKILATVPDSQNQLHRDAYQKLVDVERRIKR